MSVKTEPEVIRIKLDEFHYTVFSPEVLSQAEFSRVLTPEERVHQEIERGFNQPSVCRLPDDAGTFVHIRGKLDE